MIRYDYWSLLRWDCTYDVKVNWPLQRYELILKSFDLYTSFLNLYLIIYKQMHNIFIIINILWIIL